MNLRSLVPLVAIASLSALPLLAHHSFAAEYDDSKPVKVTGVVTRVDVLAALVADE